MRTRLRRKKASEGVPNEVRRIALVGELDLFAAPSICRDLDTITKSAVIDLTAVSLLSAAALAELARLAQRVGHRNITLTGASAHVRHVLDIVGFERLFVIE